MKKKVAAIVTVYHKWSHADVIVGKVLEGYHYDGKDGPNLQVAMFAARELPDPRRVELISEKARRLFADA